MKFTILTVSAIASLTLSTLAEVKVDNEALGKSLGGWKKKDNQAAEYSQSGTIYRTYKPEVTPTPEGGIFISLRIDNVRGWMSSDDYAVLEVTVSPQGVITSAKSNIALQGRSISSDVIMGANEAGKTITGADRAVQIGTDLISNLSAKFLNEKIVEAGRVSFPAALRHNYNLLYQALRLDGAPVPPLAPVMVPPPGAAAVPPANPAPANAPAQTPPPANPTPASPEKPKEPAPPAEPPPPVAKPVPGNAELEINPYEPSPGGDLKEQ
jgi:hypothetical protein